MFVRACVFARGVRHWFGVPRFMDGWVRRKSMSSELTLQDSLYRHSAVDADRLGWACAWRVGCRREKVSACRGETESVCACERRSEKDCACEFLCVSRARALDAA